MGGLLGHSDDGVGDYSKPTLRTYLKKWLLDEMDRLEKEIDDDGPLYILEAEKDAYDKVIEKIDSFE